MGLQLYKTLQSPLVSTLKYQASVMCITAKWSFNPIAVGNQFIHNRYHLHSPDHRRLTWDNTSADTGHRACVNISGLGGLFARPAASSFASFCRLFAGLHL